MTHVTGRFKDSVKEPAQLENSFRFYDKDQSGTLSFDEFMSALQRLGVRAKGADLMEIYQFIDSDQNDNIAYNELIELMYGTKQIDYESFVRERRKKLGLDSWISLEERKHTDKYSQKPTLMSDEYNSAGYVEGLSEIMKKSEAGSERVPQLVNEHEVYSNS